MRVARFTIGVALMAAAPPLLAAQSSDVASRIGRVRDGVVRLAFAARSDVCGDGRFIGEDSPEGFRTYAMWDHGYSVQTYQHFRPTCEHGPLLLVVEKSEGTVADLDAALGVRWREGLAVTDLGTVSAPEASRWLLAVAPQLSGNPLRVAFLAAAAADSAPIASRLIEMVEDRSLPGDVRQQAMRWVNDAARREQVMATADATIRAIAEAPEEVPAVRERAVRVLSHGPANEVFLRRLYRDVRDTKLKERIIRRAGEVNSNENAAWMRSVAVDHGEPGALRERALRVLGEQMKRHRDVQALYGQLGDPELDERVLRIVAQMPDGQGERWLREIAVDQGAALAVRERAIRLLGEQGDVAYLRDVYPRLRSRELQERVLRVVAETGPQTDRAWFERVAIDRDEPIALRDRAIRLLAELGATTDDLVALFDRVTERDLHIRLMRIYAERDDDRGVAKLIAVAQSDSDDELRRFAVRRLADADHPAAREYLETAVRRP